MKNMTIKLIPEITRMPFFLAVAQTVIVETAWNMRPLAGL